MQSVMNSEEQLPILNLMNSSNSDRYARLGPTSQSVPVSVNLRTRLFFVSAT